MCAPIFWAKSLGRAQKGANWIAPRWNLINSLANPSFAAHYLRLINAARSDWTHYMNVCVYMQICTLSCWLNPAPDPSRKFCHTFVQMCVRAYITTFTSDETRKQTSNLCESESDGNFLITRRFWTGAVDWNEYRLELSLICCWIMRFELYVCRGWIFCVNWDHFVCKFSLARWCRVILVNWLPLRSMV